ncbi:hypothetical protein OF122_07320 [Pelagibacterium flavum]|uniref:Uncharacterized protein n=1 Tax=Pelagibacterium flavum TaxID=2984530 RepID=A0ABY6ISW0_9HYPH|nr:hypothetical protein [Pelagibacterium sp. YIM 151497]UYQ73556.1 hypothetical protein OF122_07320 [Pelagibacterium sp. YIM 151497]
MKARPIIERQAFDHLLMIKAHMLSLDRGLKAIRKGRTPLTLAKMRQCYLDRRMIIEELMLLSVSAHSDAGHALERDLRSGFNAKRKMKRLEVHNPEFFPRAIDLIPGDEDGIAACFVEVTDETLSRQLAEDFYTHGDNYLHAMWKGMDRTQYGAAVEDLSLFFRLTERLMRTFEVDISGKRYMMIGHLNLHSTENPELFKAAMEP